MIAPLGSPTRRAALLRIGRAGAGLAALGGLPALVGCGGHRGIAIGSKDFTEEQLLGEMYAQRLEARGYTVERKLGLAGTEVAMEALQRGDIDLYPEYTGTALLTVLKEKPLPSSRAIYDAVKRAYAERYHLTWLAPAPFDDTQALATTQAIASRLNLKTLSDLSRAAPQLRLGSIPEFTKREDALPGLQRAYGGFQFQSIKLFDIGLKYQALLTNQVDIVVAFGTDGQIASDKLYVFVDDKHFWPAYNIAPVVRDETLAKNPHLAGDLNALAPLLTNRVMQDLNFQVDGAKRDPGDVARAFLNQHGLA